MGKLQKNNISEYCHCNSLVNKCSAKKLLLAVRSEIRQFSFHCAWRFLQTSLEKKSEPKQRFLPSTKYCSKNAPLWILHVHSTFLYITLFSFSPFFFFLHLSSNHHWLFFQYRLIFPEFIQSSCSILHRSILTFQWSSRAQWSSSIFANKNSMNLNGGECCARLCSRIL